VAEWLAWIREAERLFDDKKFDEAAGLAERVLRANPDSAQAHQVLGLVLLERGRAEEAVPWLVKTLEIQPDLVPSHNGIGQCFFLLDDLERAVAHFDTALYLQPEDPHAHFNRALSWLKLRRYREGWLEYEWRWKGGMIQRPGYARPRWDGSPLNGRTILVHTEQGLGDVLQFLRFIPLLKERGSGRVILACQRALLSLLKDVPYVDGRIALDEPAVVPFDLHAPLLSLPALLRLEEEIVPPTVAYLAADPERVERWRPRIQGLPGFRVGLYWQGRPTFKYDHLRSIALEHYAPLASVDGVSLVSLQRGPGEEQIAPNRGRVPMEVFPELNRDAPFVDTAAIMELLDLVITSDTATAHLAGALGRPVWVPLPIGADWRWLLERADCPWYPTMRLFRQKAFRDWPGVFREITAALRVEVESRCGGQA
jgi:hypothetical protein